MHSFSDPARSIPLALVGESKTQFTMDILSSWPDSTDRTRLFTSAMHS